MRLPTALLLAALWGCSHVTPPAPPTPVSAAPLALLGSFSDDYDNHFTITATDWLQLPHGRFHIVEWNPAEQFLVAQNDSASKNAPGKWTRIDWMEFSGMEPYTWGFCLSAFDAPTRAAATAAAIARRETPRTGCNGFPFSRMKRVG